MDNKNIEFSITQNYKVVNIIFYQNKFTTKDLSYFASTFYSHLKTNRTFIFNLSNLEWIAHEELVYLSGLFDQLYQNKIEFRINLLHKNPSKRKIKEVIYLWEEWQIYSFIPQSNLSHELPKYFDISSKQISELKKLLENPDHEEDDTTEINVVQDTNEKKNYYEKITPFIKLDLPKGTQSEKVVVNNLNRIFQLDEKTNKLLQQHSSDTPFLNRTLSSIISKELYENSIDHAFISSRIKKPACYMSVGLRKKLEEFEDIEKLKLKNFIEEEIFESKSFFCKNEHYINQSVIHYTFLDFGEGISKTLGQSSLDFENKNDTEILVEAFDYKSSRNPLAQRYIEKNFIPRGLFDVISIVRSYNGLIIARSNFGKLLFDFSISSNISECIQRFDSDKEYYFNGTMITILIPENEFGIKIQKIKPQYLIEATKKQNFYLNILELQKEAINKISITENKNTIIKNIYNESLNRIGTFLDSVQDKECVISVDFNGFFKDSKLTKKILYFLASDYRINEKVSVLIANLEDKDLIKQVQLTILASPKEYLTFLFHPIPCVLRNHNNFEIIWLGVDKDSVSFNLNEVLISNLHDRRLIDFDSVNDITDTGIISLDEHGNLKTIIGTLHDQSIDQLINKSTLQKKNTIYLCSGNYYQEKYIALLEHLYDYDYANYITGLLYESVLFFNKDFFKDVTHIIAITLSSQLIAKSFYQFDEIKSLKSDSEQILKNVQLLRLSNYHSFYLESDFITSLREGDSIVLICDVISTGYLITSLYTKLNNISVNFKAVLAIADTRVKDSVGEISHYFEETVNTFVLRKISVNKFSAREIDDFVNKEIVRINPATNTPITLEEDKSEIKETVLYTPEEFLGLIPNPEDFIEIGLLSYNKLFHPYFFKTHKLFKSKIGIIVVQRLMEKILEETGLNIDYVFYPIFSGAEIIDSKGYYDELFSKFGCEFIPLARFNTPLGWRFSFPPKSLNLKTLDTDVFLLDDGSCTGSTIIQMLDEISFLEVKSITLLSVIGRTDDFLREFFSRIRQIKVKHLNDKLAHLLIANNKNNQNSEIPLNIFFGTHFHIPAYPILSGYPFSEEESLLEYYRNFDSLPDILRSYISRRIEKIKLNPADSDSDLSINYLPRDFNNAIPIIDLLLMRSKIGQINSYRFYKDYFNYFNTYIKLFFEAKSLNLIYKETELILAIILHEPYLIRPVQDFIPDIYNCLLRFTQDVIVNNDEEKLFDFNKLFYQWEKANILLVYLSLRKDNPSEIFSQKNIEKILLFITKDNSLDSLKTFLMFILNFIPKSKKELYKQEEGINCLNQLVTFTNNYREPIIGKQIFTNLKQLVSFLNTVPYLDRELTTRRSCLLKLENFYKMEDSYGDHDSIEKILGIIRAQCNSIPHASDGSEQNEIIKIIKQNWKTILPSIEKILRYSKRLSEFYQIYHRGILNEQLFNSSTSLEFVINQINQIIENNTILEQYTTILNYVEDVLLPNFFIHDSLIFNLFTNFSTIGIIDIWTEEMTKIRGMKCTNKKSELAKINKIKVGIPEKYFIEVILKEIRTNFKYAEISKPIIVSWSMQEDWLKVKISNSIGIQLAKGSNNGSRVFSLITELLDFKFTHHKNDGFHQTYLFKII